MRIKELDGLRGIAVLAVIDRHYMSWYPRLGSSFGWLGVDLFFVLSGFLITSILLDLRTREKYFTIFYFRRALRIFPPYFLGLMVYIAVSFAMGMPGSWRMWLSYIFYYSSIVSTHPNLLSGSKSVPIIVGIGLTVLWSLSVEEIYYTIWAPIVRFTNERVFAAILVSMMVVAPVLRWHLHTPDFHEIYTFYCRMDGLAYGSAVALIIRHRKLHPRAWQRTDSIVSPAAALFIVFSAVFLLATGGHESSLLVCGIGLTLADISFALAVYRLVVESGGDQWWVRIFRAKWLRSIGMVSYSLYLFHLPMYIIAGELVAKLHLPRRADALGAAGLGVTLSFAIAYGLWYAMESRILSWKNSDVQHISQLQFQDCGNQPITELNAFPID